LRQYLQRELAVEPEPATLALYRQLMARTDSDPSTAATAPASAGRLPLIGRQPEWSACEAAWKAATAGQPQVLCLSGEAGIGKSRLAEQMMQHLSRQGHATAWSRCYAAEGGLAFAPVAEWLKNPAFQAVRSELQPVWLAELARLLPELLIERPELPVPEPITENWQRLRLFQSLARAILTARQPLLLVIDDLQWCDSDSLAWLRYLLRFDTGARLLLVVTIRSEELPAAPALQRWLSELRQASQLIEVALGPLNVAQTAALATQIIGRAPDARLAEWIFQETEGNPLFVVETVRGNAYQAQDGSPAPADQAARPQTSTGPDTALPLRVHTVIAARLAQLPPSARELASLAAAMGRAFTFAVLVAATDRDEVAVARDLDDLWQRLLVREQGGDAYDFSHDKIREVAYAQASAGRRRILHRRIAEALEHVYATDLDAVSGQIAAQYDQAGLSERAIPFYLRASAVAQSVYANEEAVSLLTRGLRALAALPASLDRYVQELAFQQALGIPLVALKGYQAAEVQALYARARQLYETLGREPEAPVLRGLALTSIARARYGDAVSWGQQLRQLAEHTADNIVFVEGHYVLGVSLFWLGEFEASRHHLEQALAAYNPHQRHAHIVSYAQDPAVICSIRLAYTLWYLGRPDQARQKFEAGLALAREVGHPFSLGYALTFGSWYTNDSGDAELTRQLVTSTQALAEDQGFTLWSMMSHIVAAGIQAQLGDNEVGIDQIRAGLVEYEQKGAGLGRTYFLALLARAYARQRQFAEALETLDQALLLAAEGEERWYAAELNRLRGEVMLQSGAGLAQVEARYQRALDIARGQHALALELRAALSLGRLWLGQGNPQAARQVVQEVYQKFTEGFDAPELVAAQALLQARA
jgi:predicted ATPase